MAYPVMEKTWTVEMDERDKASMASLLAFKTKHPNLFDSQFYGQKVNKLKF